MHNGSLRRTPSGSGQSYAVLSLTDKIGLHRWPAKHSVKADLYVVAKFETHQRLRRMHLEL